jgi:hypothetical protein
MIKMPAFMTPLNVEIVPSYGADQDHQYANDNFVFLGISSEIDGQASGTISPH